MSFKLSFSIIFLMVSPLLYAEPFAINLWQNSNQKTSVLYPLNQKLSQIKTPQMVVYLPKKSNHTAIIVISGGGYAREELGKEGTPVSKWLQKQGFTVFELIHRLPQNDMPIAPFADGQRAIRLARSQANHFHYDANRIGVMGFSAGGHLAAILATQFNYPFYTAQNSIDQVSARPDFTVLLYPVISMEKPLNHTHAFKSLFPKPDSNLQKQLSPQFWVTKNTPLMFIAQSQDDPISPIQNSEIMTKALQEKNIPVQFFSFKTGGHGWGLGKPNTPTQTWTTDFLSWFKAI